MLRALGPLHGPPAELESDGGSPRALICEVCSVLGRVCLVKQADFQKKGYRTTGRPTALPSGRVVFTFPVEVCLFDIRRLYPTDKWEFVERIPI